MLLTALTACASQLPAPDALPPVRGARAPVTVVAYPKLADTAADDTTMSLDDVKTHLAYLTAAQYHLMSWAQVLAAAHGTASLPPQAVLLAFRSTPYFYNNVLPLLTVTQTPAIVINDTRLTIDQRRALTASGMVVMPRVSDVRFVAQDADALKDNDLLRHQQNDVTAGFNVTALVPLFKFPAPQAAAPAPVTPATVPHD